MASWKEIGFVPDSDEEDLLDSQSTTDDDPSRDDGFHDIDDYGDPDDTELQEQSHEENSKVYLGDLSVKGDFTTSSHIGNSQIPADQSTRTLRRDSTSPTPKSFQIPQGIQDLLEPNDSVDQDELHSGEAPAKPHNTQVEQSNDEISKSYVQLQSAASSPLSSAPDSPIDPQEYNSAIFHHGLWSSSPDELAEGHEVVAAGEDSVLYSDLDMTSAPVALEAIEIPRVRSFRERRPIQLHPYAMEEAKYRRTALASGIRPVKVAQYQSSQQHRRRQSENQDQEFETADESQSIREEATLPPSSSLPQPMSQDDVDMIDRPNTDALREHDGDDNDDDNDDDDLPDVNDLLHGTKKQPRLKSKQPRAGRPTLESACSISGPREEQRSSSQSVTPGADIWDLPSSPPPARNSPAYTKKPFLHRTVQQELTSPSSSRRPSPFTDHFNRNSSLDPITPATSVITPMVDLTNVSDESSDDTSEDSAGEVEADSEPDDSLQVQRVGRRIRGVLPASWLRLDQKVQQPQEPTTHQSRKSEIVTHITKQSKRGVALPVLKRDVRSLDISQADHHVHGMPFLSDESDQSDRDVDIGRLSEGAHIDLGPDKYFVPSQADSLQEDNRIDAMLSSRKRQSSFSIGRKKSKKRRISSSLFPVPGQKYKRQPRITERFSEVTNEEVIGRAKPRTSKSQPSHAQISSRRSRPKPSRLSVLDVTEPGEMPQFLRIAARNARSRKDLGRHSPTRKFIRLANRTDTEDANSILRQWRGASIPQSAAVNTSHRMKSRKEEIKLSLNQSYPELGTSGFQSIVPQVASNRGPKKLLISNPRQSHLRFPELPEFSNPSDVTRQSQVPKPAICKRLKPAMAYAGPARQAQLERLESEYNSRHPAAAFVNTKRNLDVVYRRGRRENAAGRGTQMSRFLADDDDPIIQNNVDQVASTSGLHSRNEGLQAEVTKRKTVRRRKGIPVRLDAGTADFRQPTESLLIKKVLDPVPLAAAHKGGKLLGLGNYGSQYTTNFDIFPLDSSVFFHESTFIGSGCLARIIDLTPHRDFSEFAGYCSHQLEEKELRWGAWEGPVSSEFGLCFEWLADNLESVDQNDRPLDAGRPRATMDFILRYVQYHLSFPTQESRQHFISRFLEVLQSYNSRMQTLSGENVDVAGLRMEIETIIRVCALLLLALQIAKGGDTPYAVLHQLEIQLQTTSAITMDLLLRAGLQKVRGFYEDCQLLSYREAGIRNNVYVEGWVILMNLLSVANIPRVSFWDVFNPRLQKEDISVAVDASVLENMWYALFSLLPLTRFDAAGVLLKTVGVRPSLENWILPQQLAKRVFTLYSQSQKQSPSFNEYCRTIFRRCHSLILFWHWDRCGSIVGTLFDFFASHKLAHLRNEESFQSPSFLQELSGDPSLVVETGDLCFHILLKIIAIAIKRFHHADDLKSIRNLVTRVLPNHNRQYPKEEPIRVSDLASLRNHHDLLSTLFWAAPPNSRPSLTLLRDLVIPEQSHKEACLIHLHTWTNLASFLILHQQETTTSKAIIDWHKEFVLSFIAERQAVQDNLDKLLKELAASDATNIFDEQDIRKVATSNMDSATDIIADAISAFNTLSIRQQSFEAYKALFDERKLHHLT